MATHRTSELETALCNKGYAEDNTHRKMYWYYFDGRKTALRTRTSQGERTFDDWLFDQRRKQMGNLSKQQMIDFMECRFTGDMYKQYLLDNDVVKP